MFQRKKCLRNLLFFSFCLTTVTRTEGLLRFAVDILIRLNAALSVPPPIHPNPSPSDGATPRGKLSGPENVALRANGRPFFCCFVFCCCFCGGGGGEFSESLRSQFKRSWSRSGQPKASCFLLGYFLMGRGDIHAPSTHSTGEYARDHGDHFFFVRM